MLGPDDTVATGGHRRRAYTPPADADPVDGKCPYLTKDQVQSDTGQRTGPVRVRPAEPQPVCEFIRSDGTFLATVRVLELGRTLTATPRWTSTFRARPSNPESRPAGWTGGSMATDDGSTYAVSEGPRPSSPRRTRSSPVYARLLVVARHREPRPLSGSGDPLSAPGDSGRMGP